MPATALEVLPLETMKAELRIPVDESDHDTMLSGQIARAVAFVAQHTGLPLVDELATYSAPPPAQDCPLCIGNVRNALEVREVKYWSSAEAFRAEADEEIAVADVGRLETRNGNQLFLYPPADGWPEVPVGTCFQVKIRRGVATVPEYLQQAAICQVRIEYNGGAMRGEEMGVDRLMRPGQVQV